MFVDGTGVTPRGIFTSSGEVRIDYKEAGENLGGMGGSCPVDQLDNLV
jgi:hypothetical protein